MGGERGQAALLSPVPCPLRDASLFASIPHCRVPKHPCSQASRLPACHTTALGINTGAEKT